MAGCNWFVQKPASLPEEERIRLAKDLARVSREEGRAGLRAWLKARDPKTAELVISSLDNNLDRTGRARLDALEAIAALGAEGLSHEAVHQWAEALRRLAVTSLHVGSDRDAMVLKSYQMEGLGDPANVR